MGCQLSQGFCDTSVHGAYVGVHGADVGMPREVLVW